MERYSKRWYEYYSRQVATYIFVDTVINSNSSNCVMYFDEIADEFFNESDDFTKDDLSNIRLQNMIIDELLNTFNVLDATLGEDNFDVIVGTDYCLHYIDMNGEEE